MSDKRPNVLVILTDDQGCWAMGCAGNSEIRTPNLDRLAASGIRFENMFCTSPVCSPARASLLTGRIPSQHGVQDWIRDGNMPADNAPAIEYLAGMTGYSEILAQNGYTCGLSGKWHLGDSIRPQKGFSHWFVHQCGGGSYYNAPMIRDGTPYEEPAYVTDAITDDALAFIDAQKDAAGPFYLSVHYTAPHSPWNRKQHPQGIFNPYYDQCPFESCPNIPCHPWQTATAPRGTGERRREILSGYFAAVTAADANVGRILDKLEDLKLRQNTLVFFTSDNGMNMGHHGIYGKGNGTFPLNMYDTSVKVPGIVSLPGKAPEGKVETGLYSHYDWMPTLLDYLGMENPEAANLPGTSFAPLLHARSIEGRQNVVVFDEYGPVRMIRNRQWKYIHRYPYGPHELYDLAADPDEANNLIDEKPMAATIEKMRAALDEFFLRHADPDLDGRSQAVYGSGQLDRVGAAGGGRAAFAGRPRYIDQDGEQRGDDEKGVRTLFRHETAGKRKKSWKKPKK